MDKERKMILILGCLASSLFILFILAILCGIGYVLCYFLKGWGLGICCFLIIWIGLAWCFYGDEIEKYEKENEQESRGKADGE